MNILFLDTSHKILWQKFTEAGFRCYSNYTSGFPELKNDLIHADGVIIRSRLSINEKFLSHAPRLKFIGRVGAGMENIDLAAAKNRGIQCFNSPEGNRDAVGEHALGMLLCLLNKIRIADAEVRKGLWRREENRGIEIKEKTVGIIGYGNMGSAFAQRLKGFETHVIAYDKYKFNYSDDFVKEVQLEELFERSDVVSLHIPLTPETQDMVNDSFLNSFKKDIYLINTARGKVVNSVSLVDALKNGKVKGAALDVLEYEKKSFESLLEQNKLPASYEYLTASDRVLLTPHIAGWTMESAIKLSSILADKILKAFS